MMGHPERSEGSRNFADKILRCAQNDTNAVLRKGATLQLSYGVGRGFESGRVGSGLIGFPESGGGTSLGSRNGTSRGSGTGTSVGIGRTGRTGRSLTGSSCGNPGSSALARRTADRSSECNIIS
jgi:hypothetical protein